MRSCLGVVLAGLTARAGVGVGSLEEAIHALENSHAEGNTGYRFALRDGEIIVQVQHRSPESDDSTDWRTLVELGS